MSALQIRELSSDADYRACVQLQKETWGQHFTEAVPATILRVSQKVGGIAAGAFDDGRLVGFVFGIAGIENGEIVHWSDMLAVTPSHRNRGIGEQLKLYQKRTLLERGVRRVLWTFDPLECKNAHLNFKRLGVYAREYVIDMYGETSSPLHAYGTDRLIAVWDLERLPQSYTPEIEIEIPGDIHAIGRIRPEEARAWRERTRTEFMAHLPGYVVTGFEKRGERGYYGLTSASNFAV